MNPNIVFQDAPQASPQRLREMVLRLVDQLGDGATVGLVTGVSFASGVNKIRHGLARAPRSVSVSPYSNVAWWAPTRPDNTFLYVTTAAALTGDLYVWI